MSIAAINALERRIQVLEDTLKVLLQEKAARARGGGEPSLVAESAFKRAHEDQIWLGLAQEDIKKLEKDVANILSAGNATSKTIEDLLALFKMMDKDLQAAYTRIEELEMATFPGMAKTMQQYSEITKDRGRRPADNPWDKRDPKKD